MFNFAKVKGIIFDLDDTLVKTKLNFSRLKQEIGCRLDEDILSFINRINCPIQQAQATETVLKHELEDAQTSTWLPGAQDFVQQASALALPLAIVTRNCKQATDVKIQKNRIPIELVLTRDDAPAKPDPTALLTIAKQWQIKPEEIAYIGDYIYDIQAAHNGNMQAWLYKPKENTDTVTFAHNLTFIPPNVNKLS